VANQSALAGDKQTRPQYRGRFAPSPTGPLHFGSLVAAVVSYLQALVAGGEWLLRIEDIDPPREPAGAAEQIIDALSVHGFRWSGDILFQRHNLQRFEAVAESLFQRGLAFACTCSRETVRATARTGPVGPIYPGTCRDKTFDSKKSHAIRMRTANQHVSFEDRLQGHIDCSLDKDIGDFIIRRKDGLIAYSLAVVLDDHDQGITEIVRGIDLLQFTPAQIHLQRVLGLNTPAYMHVPIAVTQNSANRQVRRHWTIKPRWKTFSAASTLWVRSRHHRCVRHRLTRSGLGRPITGARKISQIAGIYPQSILIKIINNIL